MGSQASHFGDIRLDRVHRDMHDKLVKKGPRGVSVRSLGGDRAGEMRYFRFLHNEKVTAEKIIEHAAHGTAARVKGQHILAIQDTTSFRDDGSGNSLVGHATIAVEAELGTLLGLVDAPIIERKKGGKKPARKRPLRDKQSYRWIEGMQSSARVLETASQVTVVADREGDIYEMFACRPEGVEVLVRASHDRVLPGGAGKLFGSLSDRPEAVHTVSLPARPGQRKREARIAVRYGEVMLSRPKGRSVEKAVPSQQLVYMVEAREIDPPEGVKSAHWRLLTSHPVESFSQARWITQLYRRRWVIEQFFRTIKTRGFDIERVSSMETAPFRKLCAMTLEAGISCLQLVQDRDGDGNRPLQDVFEVEDQPALEAVSAQLEGKTEKQKNPHPKGSLAFGAWVCARLGGWNCYYGKPGPVVMLRGLYSFRTMQFSYAIAYESGYKKGRKASRESGYGSRRNAGSEKRGKSEYETGRKFKI